MRKLLLFAVVGLIGFTGCKEAKPVKTIEHLKEAIKGETTASAKYAAFAQKAREEGHEAIGKLFDAASKAEGIHADNHKKALEALGEKMESFNPEFEVKTTAENLKAAIDGEGYETDKMYPQFLADAKTEKVEKAIKSFNWANDTEKKHLVFYKNALEALNANTEDKLPTGYAVCPVCGNTYENGAIDEKCAFCQTDKAKYINF